MLLIQSPSLHSAPEAILSMNGCSGHELYVLRRSSQLHIKLLQQRSQRHRRLQQCKLIANALPWPPTEGKEGKVGDYLANSHERKNKLRVIREGSRVEVLVRDFGDVGLRENLIRIHCSRASAWIEPRPPFDAFACFWD